MGAIELLVGLTRRDNPKLRLNGIWALMVSHKSGVYIFSYYKFVSIFSYAIYLLVAFNVLTFFLQEFSVSNRAED